MRMRSNLVTAALVTAALTVLLGVLYPLAMTALAQALFHDKANGQLVVRDGRIVGSATIGQRFSSPAYFHGRPSAAGDGYDAASSGGTNLGPTNRKLIDAVKSSVDAAKGDNPGVPVPIDLVTASASGLDPHISPDAALFQVPRVANARGLSQAEVRRLVLAHVEDRQLGLLGEPRVNVLLLNLDLDRAMGRASKDARYSSVKR
jgi:K+-transporting ATPase ATPase C chain